MGFFGPLLPPVICGSIDWQTGHSSSYALGTIALAINEIIRVHIEASERVTKKRAMTLPESCKNVQPSRALGMPGGNAPHTQGLPKSA